MGIFGSHPGSWGGLPDWGITEWLQGQLPRQVQAREDTAGINPAPAPTPTPPDSSGGDVLSSATMYDTPAGPSPDEGSPTTTQTTQPSAATNTGGQPTSGQTSQPRAPAEPTGPSVEELARQREAAEKEAAINRWGATKQSLDQAKGRRAERLKPIYASIPWA